MAVFILILALAESACSRPYGIQETATIAAEEAVIMAVTKSIIDDYFRTHEAKDNMGAFFLVVAGGTESRFRGFMSDHHPRLEIGLSNLIKEGNGTYRDKLSGRSGALIRITTKTITKDHATAAGSVAAGPLGGSWYSFELTRTKRGWIVTKKRLEAVS